MCYVMEWGGGGGVYGSAHISVTKVHGPMLLALREGGGVQFSEKVLHNTFKKKSVTIDIKEIYKKEIYIQYIYRYMVNIHEK